MSRRSVIGTACAGALAIGLGCWGMSGSYGPADEEESVATLHQNVGDGLAQPPALRNREQMPLALGVGIGEQC